MAITRTPIHDDDGSGTTGTILDNAWKQEFYNQIDAAIPSGAWVDVPFTAANFSGGSGLIWTVGSGAIIRNRYALIGKTMFWSFYISWFSGGNVLSGTPGPVLNITIPGGWQAPAPQSIAIDFCAGIAGLPSLGGLYGGTTGFSLAINRLTGNFALTDIPGIVANLTFEVQ